MIALDHLSLGYGRRILMCDVDATVADGRLVALIGRNGSGKSTLLRALAGIERPVGGRVLVDGIAIGSLAAQQRARKVAFVASGRAHADRMTATEAVSLARAPYTGWSGSLSADDKRIVAAALSQVGMSEYADRHIDSLSDGEAQRIMIARALAQDTPVLLLDEPTAPLDLPSRHRLGQMLGECAHGSGRTVIFSTHELDIALRYADDIMLIDTPRLLLLDVPTMLAEGHIRRLFGEIVYGDEYRKI